MKPKIIDAVSSAFPTSVDEFIPHYKDLPDEFKDGNTPQNKLFSKAFFKGCSTEFLKEKPGINRAEALRHIGYVMGSWEPKYEHKEAGVAWLFAQWFEPFTDQDVVNAKTP